MKPVAAYKTLVFDCDGVLLDSNTVKTQAFYQAAMPYGEEAAKALVAFHTANGGVSRYKKFQYFLDFIVPQYSPDLTGPSLDDLLDSYAVQARQGLIECAVAPGLQQLRNQAASSRWLIVSGGDQAELREVFAWRQLDKLFDGGIFGSPDTKDVILARELSAGNIVQPALFLGDSKYDYTAAMSAGLDFVFLSDWTEVADWQSWTARDAIVVRGSLQQLLD